MRTTLVPAMAIVAASFSVSVAAAQTPTTSANAEVVATYLTDRLKGELNLTPEQIPKVKAIGVKGATELETLINKYAPDTSKAGDAALVRGMLSTMQSSQRELKTVLTPEQWATHQGNRAQRIALNQTEIMAYTLDLSRQQILDVERINLTSANKMVRALDQPVGAPKRTQAQTLQVLEPMIAQRDTALVKVLTTAQWTEMQENRRALRDLLVEQAQVATTKPAKD